MRRLRPLLASLLPVLLLACERADPLAPPVVHWGQDICSECGMIVSDDRYAAALIARSGSDHESQLFDDIGCLLISDARLGEAVAARYVRDAANRTWLGAEAAAYLRSAELHTPMASGLAGFASMAEVDAGRERWPGDILDYAALRSAHASGTLAAAPWAAAEGSSAADDADRDGR